MKTEQELRELDAWIAKHVMGWKVFKTTKEWVKAGSPIAPKHTTVLDQSPRLHFPEYTTDLAAAMMVLEKCHSETFLSMRKQSNGGTYIWWGMNGVEMSQFGETLPLAICLFAKQLFSTAASAPRH